MMGIVDATGLNEIQCECIRFRSCKIKDQDHQLFQRPSHPLLLLALPSKKSSEVPCFPGDSNN